MYRIPGAFGGIGTSRGRLGRDTFVMSLSTLLWSVVAIAKRCEPHNFA